MSRLISFLAVLCLLASCEKKEQALVLPPPTGASHASVNLGAAYERQIFFDFDKEEAVLTSGTKAWDLAFEAGPEGRHVFMNGGKGVFVFNTHQHDIRGLTELPDEVATTGWQYDTSSCLSDSTGIGQWYLPGGGTKDEVYLVKIPDGIYYKMRIRSCTADGYTLEWAPLESGDKPVMVELIKDTAYNYVYFSFSDGIVRPEPPKASWDVVFTRYRPMVFDVRNQMRVPYPVTGVLLNPAGTMAAADSLTPFAQITQQKAMAMQASGCRDVIGYDWKTIDLYGLGGRYTVNRSKNYILHTRKGRIYKLRFLDYYNSSGEKGNPLFEFERLR